MTKLRCRKWWQMERRRRGEPEAPQVSRATKDRRANSKNVNQERAQAPDGRTEDSRRTARRVGRSKLKAIAAEAMRDGVEGCKRSRDRRAHMLDEEGERRRERKERSGTNAIAEEGW